MYGRLSWNDNCGSGRSNCKSSSSLSEVRKRCQSKRKCKVPSSNSVFGDPCQNTQKYLTVDFDCLTDCEYYRLDCIDWKLYSLDRMFAPRLGIYNKIKIYENNFFELVYLLNSVTLG